MMLNREGNGVDHPGLSDRFYTGAGVSLRCMATEFGGYSAVHPITDTIRGHISVFLLWFRKFRGAADELIVDPKSNNRISELASAN
ncbi:unnamed protein product, partial [Mesorhabditis spiculigera]